MTTTKSQPNSHNGSVFSHEALFNGVDASGHSELWVTDGTAVGTHELIIPGASTSGLNPICIAAFGNEALFNGDGNLWITDGTVAGTHELNNIPGASTAPYLQPLDITAISKHEALFGGTDSLTRHELWVTDGTVAGTHELIIPGEGTAALPVAVWPPTASPHSPTERRCSQDGTLALIASSG